MKRKSIITMAALAMVLTGCDNRPSGAVKLSRELAVVAYEMGMVRAAVWAQTNSGSVGSEFRKFYIEESGAFSNRLNAGKWE